MRWSDTHSLRGCIARFGRVAVLSAAALLGACDLVLGIDDVSSANGPDSGQRISASTADPSLDASALEDAGVDEARD